MLTRRGEKKMCEELSESDHLGILGDQRYQRNGGFGVGCPVAKEIFVLLLDIQIEIQMKVTTQLLKNEEKVQIEDQK